MTKNRESGPTAPKSVIYRKRDYICCWIRFLWLLILLNLVIVFFLRANFRVQYMKV